MEDPSLKDPSPAASSSVLHVPNKIKHLAERRINDLAYAVDAYQPYQKNMHSALENPGCHHYIMYVRERWK